MLYEWVLEKLLYIPTAAAQQVVTNPPTPADLTASKTVTVGQTLTNIPFDAWIAVFGPTTFAAIFLLALQLKKGTPDRIAFVVLYQLMSSWCAGLIAFVFAEWQDYNDLLEVLIIFIAGFGGAKFIDVVVTNFLGRAGALAGGGTQPPAPPAPPQP